MCVQWLYLSLMRTPNKRCRYNLYRQEYKSKCNTCLLPSSWINIIHGFIGNRLNGDDPLAFVFLIVHHDDDIDQNCKWCQLWHHRSRQLHALDPSEIVPSLFNELGLHELIHTLLHVIEFGNKLICRSRICRNGIQLIDRLRQIHCLQSTLLCQDGLHLIRLLSVDAFVKRKQLYIVLAWLLLLRPAQGRRDILRRAFQTHNLFYF